MPKRANRPPAGITVLDFGQVYQGHYATLLMAKGPKPFLITHYRQPFCSRPKPVEQRFLPAMTLPRMSIPGQAISNLMVGAAIRPFFTPSRP